MCSPPAKRARLELAERAPKSHFHTLTEDGLENIIRYVSERPRSADWKKHVSAADMRALFKCGGPLSAAARRLLCKFLSSRVKWNAYLEQESTAILSPERILFHDLISEGAESFVEVAIDGTVPFHRFGATFSNLRSLSITNSNYRLFHDSSVLRNSPLESLELEGTGLGEVVVDQIALHCKQLRSLRLAFCLASMNVSSIFKVVGPTLEELALSRERREYEEDFDSEFEDDDCWVISVLSTVARHCKKLRTAKFGGFGFDESVTSDFVRLCANSRAQLRNLELMGPAEENFLKEVSEVCPKLSILLRCQSDNYKEQLLAMGPCAANLWIFDHEHLPPFSDMFDEDSAKEISSRCTNFSDINLHFDSSHCHIYSAFLSFPKPKLHSLTINFNETHTDFTSSDVFDALSKFNTIRTLHFIGKVPSVKSVRKMVSENRQLEKVKIKRTGNDCRCRFRVSSNNEETGPERFDWVPLAKVLYSCPELQNMELSCGYAVRVEKTEAFADACLLFRRRRLFSAAACGYDYL